MKDVKNMDKEVEIENGRSGAMTRIIVIKGLEFTDYVLGAVNGRN